MRKKKVTRPQKASRARREPVRKSDGFDISILFTKEDLTIAKILELKDKIYSSITLRREFEHLVREFIDDLSKKLSSETKTLTRKGIAYWILNRTEDAISLLEKAWASREASYFLALAYLDAGRYSSAYDLLKDLRKDEPNHLEFIIPFIDTLIKKGEVEEARAIIEKARKQFRSNPDLAYYAGLSREHLGESEKAESEYRHALRLKPGHSRTLFRLACRADRAGRDEAAIALYERLSQAKPTHLNVLINLGLLYEDKNEYDKALACYQTVLEYNPNHPRARLYLKDALSAKVMYYDEEAKHREARLRQMLQTPLTDFRLSQRSQRSLQKLRIKTLGDLVKKTEGDLLKCENFGMTSLNEIKDILARRGLTLAPEGLPPQVTTPQLFGAERPVKASDARNKSLMNFEWSARTRSTFARLKIYTIGDLANKTENELIRIKNFGQTSLKEIKHRLASLGLTLKPGEDFSR